MCGRLQLCVNGGCGGGGGGGGGSALLEGRVLVPSREDKLKITVTLWGGLECLLLCERDKSAVREGIPNCWC